jgi:hypothetical protein
MAGRVGICPVHGWPAVDARSLIECPIVEALAQLPVFPMIQAASLGD